MAGFNTLRGLSESQLSEAAGGLTLEEIGQAVADAAEIVSTSGLTAAEAGAAIAGVEQLATDVQTAQSAADTNTGELTAIKAGRTATETGTQITNAVQSTDIDSIEQLTQAEYDAITPIDTTMYVIVG